MINIISKQPAKNNNLQVQGSYGNRKYCTCRTPCLQRLSARSG